MSHDKPTKSDFEKSQYSDRMIGQIFDVYQITRELGRGGMGVVYLAKRADNTFYQDVAIKFLKRGLDTDSILKRFRNERQILAALNHPNVALLYDGGTTDDGLPYFVMEYVVGKPLYQFCDEQKLSVKKRLKIFVQICQAVHAAHQIKVIHRDLKPSNILVKPDGTPKLLDFGIAKLLDPELADATLEPTATHLRMMTPEYASPEQVSGGEISPASDVYSLGVLLYELLSGHRPYRLKSGLPYEVARAICEQYPESLGKSLESRENFAAGDSTQTLEKVLEERGSNLRQLQSELAGDLERIVMNALQKESADRYQTALEMAEDIELYLTRKPIKKRSPVAFRNLNRASESKLSLAVMPLKIIGSMTTSEDADSQYLSVGLADAIITRFSNIKRIIVRPTSAVLRFAHMTDALEVGRELETNYVLSGTIRRAGTRIRISIQLISVESESTLWAGKFDEELTDVLELEDKIAEKIGNLLVPQLTGEEQKELSKRGTNNPQAFDAYIRARYNLFLLTPEGIVNAKTFFEEAINLDPDYALAYVGLADLFFALTTFGTMPPLQAYATAGAMARRALEIDDSLGEAYAVLAVCSHENYDFVTMEKLLRRSVELNPNYPLSRIWLANLLTFYGKSEEAIAEAERAVRLNPAGTFEKRQLAWIYSHNRRLDKALEMSKAAVDAEPNNSQSLTFYSRILRLAEKIEESLTAAERAVKFDDQTPLIVTNYAASLAAANHDEKAQAVLQKLENLPADVYVSPFNMAIAYANLGDIEQTFKWLEYGYQTKDQRLTWIVTDPQFDSLRDNPRFQKIVADLKNLSAKG